MKSRSLDFPRRLRRRLPNKYVALLGGHSLVVTVSCIGANAPCPSRGFILSPSATLRVAGLAPRVKVEHTTV